MPKDKKNLLLTIPKKHRPRMIDLVNFLMALADTEDRAPTAEIRVRGFSAKSDRKKPRRLFRLEEIRVVRVDGCEEYIADDANGGLEILAAAERFLEADFQLSREEAEARLASTWFSYNRNEMAKTISEFLSHAAANHSQSLQIALWSYFPGNPRNYGDRLKDGSLTGWERCRPHLEKILGQPSLALLDDKMLPA